MKYCSECGGRVRLQIVEGETHHRFICENCNTIHYQNPKIITGCLVYKNNKVLLCKRAIEPRSGLWTVPGGYMENGETSRNAAHRETLEETGSDVNLKELFVIANSPHANHVNLIYLAELQQANFHPTTESSEVCLFSANEIPWDDIAFYTVKLTLTWFFEDQSKGWFLLHEIDF